MRRRRRSRTLSPVRQMKPLLNAVALAATFLCAVSGGARANFSVDQSSRSRQMMQDLEILSTGDAKTSARFFDQQVPRSGGPVAPPIRAPESFVPSAAPRPPQADAPGRSAEAAAAPTAHPAAPAKSPTLTAVRETPKRFANAWRDPLRRRNGLSRVGEALVGGGAAVLGFMALGWWGLPLAIVAEFAYYEYIAEPNGWSGPYWERGPRDGETFKRP